MEITKKKTESKVKMMIDVKASYVSYNKAKERKIKENERLKEENKEKLQRRKSSLLLAKEAKIKEVKEEAEKLKKIKEEMALTKARLDAAEKSELKRKNSIILEQRMGLDARKKEGEVL